MKDSSTYNNTSEKGFPPYTLWKNLAIMASVYQLKILYVEIKVELRSFCATQYLHIGTDMSANNKPTLTLRSPHASPHRESRNAVT